MRITNFEMNFLGIDEVNDGFNPYVIRLFHTLLQKVEMDPYRQWTHDLLRNYVNASYSFCSNLNANRKDKIVFGPFKKSKENKEKIKLPQMNIYEDEDTGLKVFFTGLYTPGTYQGLKNGLYFVVNPSEEQRISVKTRKEIIETNSKTLDGKNVLKLINHRDSFENELVDDMALNIQKIILPTSMNLEVAQKIIRELKCKIDPISEILNKLKKTVEEVPLEKYKVNTFIKDKLKEIEKISSKDIETIKYLKNILYKEDKIKNNPWLHILRDGIDNIPTDFVLSFFNKEFEVPSPVDRYKNRYKKRKEWIDKCILNTCSNNEDNSFMYYQEIMLDTMQAILDKSNIHNLPVHFYIKLSTYNYLLPMYLLNSGKPDFCIVLMHMKDKDGKYTGDWEPVTSLNMDEVYCNIRVFGKDAVERVRDWW